MTRQGYPGNRKTIKDDIDVLNKFGMDIITNISRGNSFYMASREFEIPELKLLVDAVLTVLMVVYGMMIFII